jgi:hypothetical protein
MESSFIKVENKLSHIDGDSSGVAYRFSLDKPFCPQEVIVFLRSFLEETFNPKFIEEVNASWHKDFEELEIEINDFYFDLEMKIKNNPEEYGLTQQELDDVLKYVEDNDNMIEEGEEVKEQNDIEEVHDVEKFKDQLNKNPEFLKTVFQGYLRDMLGE